jgi:hypothetical protein
MAEPIFRAGLWWVLGDDGRWLRWEQAKAGWVPDDVGPPDYSSVPPPPPPPPAALGYPTQEVSPGNVTPTIVASSARSRHRLVKVVAVVLVVAMVPLGWRAYSVLGPGSDNGSTSNDEGGAVAVPSATPANVSSESTIYDHPFGPAACPFREEDNSESAAKAGLDGALASIADHDVDIRALSFRKPVRTQNLSLDRFKSKLERSATPDTAKEREALRDYGRVLELLKVVPQATDFESLVTDVTTTQIAGFYDPSTKKIVVPGSIADPSPFDEFVLSHELEHALADQNLGLPLDENASSLESEEQLAARAVIEGDASLTSVFYAAFNMTPEDLVALQSDESVTQADSQEIPYILERSFSFPYVEGLNFACFLYAQNGWKSVDDAYRRPPHSTAEILFPERYPGPPPENPPNPSTPKGWRRIEISSLGAFDLLTLFEAPGGTKTSEPAGVVDGVRRFNGGELTIWTKGDDVAFTMTVIDEPGLAGANPTPHMCAHMRLWFSLNYTDGSELDTGDFEDIVGRKLDDGVALLQCSSDIPNLTFAIAPDVATASSLIGDPAKGLPDQLN